MDHFYSGLLSKLISLSTNSVGTKIDQVVYMKVVPCLPGRSSLFPHSLGRAHLFHKQLVVIFLLMVVGAETSPASAALVKLPFSDRSCEMSSGTAWEFVNSLAPGCESWWCKWQQRFNKHLCIFLSSLESTPDSREPAACAF